MKRYIFLLTFLFALCFSIPCFSQAQAIYSQGAALMKQKQWEEAKTYFIKAKGLDSSLSEKCDKQITICNKKLKKKVGVKSVKSERKEEYSDNSSQQVMFELTVSPQNLKFDDKGNKVKTASVQSISKGVKNVWTYTNDKSWVNCTQHGNSLEIFCDENKDFYDRTATVKISNDNGNQSIKITQSAWDTIFVTTEKGDPYNLDFKKKGGQRKEVFIHCPDYDYEIVNQPNQRSLHLSKNANGNLVIETTESDTNFWNGKIEIQSNKNKDLKVYINVVQGKWANKQIKKVIN